MRRPGSNPADQAEQVGFRRSPRFHQLQYILLIEIASEWIGFYVPFWPGCVFETGSDEHKSRISSWKKSPGAFARSELCAIICVLPTVLSLCRAICRVMSGQMLLCNSAETSYPVDATPFLLLVGNLFFACTILQELVVIPNIVVCFIGAACKD